MSITVSATPAWIGLTAAMIEIGGWAGTLLLLAPLALLLLVVVYVSRGASSVEAPPRTRATTPSPAAHSSVQGIANLGTGAERARDDGADEAARHLALARTEIANGRHGPAADHLRSCIRSAVESRNEAAAAEARLGLAELAREAGDLTTACEHWQIARALFHQLQEKPALARTEELMRRHGCPTDWVLNDF